ncbi:MAG: thioredoxin domain-containing protein [Myxococcota bacterium]|nr:thioredoxin domain-containing protein [Myxococcota bacterium]
MKQEPTPQQKKRFKKTAFLCWAALIGVGLSGGCENGRGALENGASEAAPQTAAVVDQHIITLTEVDERIQQALFYEAFGDDAASLYAARQEAVDELVGEYLLEQAALADGQTPEAWLDRSLTELPPIGEQEVTDLFEQARDRLPPEAQPEDYAEPLRAFLAGQRIGTILDGLREQAQVKVSLPRQRAQIEAVGPSLGPPSAPVTLVEFSDFQCPYCARAVPTLKALREKYPDELRVVYRHMPLGFHPNARAAAIAATCADAQGLFWPYHDQLFEQQNALTAEDLMTHAEAVGLDAVTFKVCLEAPETAATVDADNLAAESAGVTGTPAFFINGIFLSGAQPLEVFEAVIDEELQQARP